MKYLTLSIVIVCMVLFSTTNVVSAQKLTPVCNLAQKGCECSYQKMLALMSSTLKPGGWRLVGSGGTEQARKLADILMKNMAANAQNHVGLPPELAVGNASLPKDADAVASYQLAWKIHQGGRKASPYDDRSTGSCIAIGRHQPVS